MWSSDKTAVPKGSIVFGIMLPDDGFTLGFRNGVLYQKIMQCTWSKERL